VRRATNQNSGAYRVCDPFAGPRSRYAEPTDSGLADGCGVPDSMATEDGPSTSSRVSGFALKPTAGPKEPGDLRLIARRKLCERARELSGAVVVLRSRPDPTFRKAVRLSAIGFRGAFRPVAPQKRGSVTMRWSTLLATATSPPTCSTHLR
jgi:hypothetical protein